MGPPTFGQQVATSNQIRFEQGWRSSRSITNGRVLRCVSVAMTVAGSSTWSSYEDLAESRTGVNCLKHRSSKKSIDAFESQASNQESTGRATEPKRRRLWTPVDYQGITDYAVHHCAVNRTARAWIQEARRGWAEPGCAPSRRPSGAYCAITTLTVCGGVLP